MRDGRTGMLGAMLLDDMDITILEQLALLGRVAIAMLLGGFIGLEREYANRPAGFRTHMLIAGAAALLVGLGEALLVAFNPLGDALRSDPIRLVEAVVAAVGFIGAGAIIQSKRTQEVHGLTTASSLLLVAAIGVGVGVRQYVLSVGVTVLALLILIALRYVESWLRPVPDHEKPGDGKPGGGKPGD